MRHATQVAQDKARELQTELWALEILEGHITLHDASATPPTTSKIEFAAEGLTVDAVLANDNKAGAKKTMGTLRLPSWAPFRAAVQAAKTAHAILSKKEAGIPPVFWVRKARDAFGQGTFASVHTQHTASRAGALRPFRRRAMRRVDIGFASPVRVAVRVRCTREPALTWRGHCRPPTNLLPRTPQARGSLSPRMAPGTCTR